MRSQVSSSRQGGLRLGSSSKDGAVYKVIIFKTSFTLLDDICFNPIKIRLLVVVLTSTNDERGG
jgi:hypothetical protein